MHIYLIQSVLLKTHAQNWAERMIGSCPRVGLGRIILAQGRAFWNFHFWKLLICMSSWRTLEKTPGHHLFRLVGSRTIREWSHPPRKTSGLPNLSQEHTRTNIRWESYDSPRRIAVLQLNENQPATVHTVIRTRNEWWRCITRTRAVRYIQGNK
jgi:hypothetical protein